jgi:DNA gyrase/topoisomerase IV subunit A
MAEGEKIIQINIEDEMKSAYIDYSMSVIVSRALPTCVTDLNRCIVVYYMVCKI